MTEFTPLSSLAGGALIGLAAVLMMAWQGRIAGISGIAAGLVAPWRDGPLVASRAAFLLGLAAAPLLWMAVTGRTIIQTVSPDVLLMAAAGLLVGFGTVLGGGCTSGHGVCGIARLSPRSLLATAIFMATAIITVFVARHVVGA
jgi:uncharacterized membrane protein YedE/YeeE